MAGTYVKETVFNRAIQGNHILLHSNGRVCLTGLRYCQLIPEDQVALHAFPDHAKDILPWVAPEILQQVVCLVIAAVTLLLSTW